MHSLYVNGRIMLLVTTQHPAGCCPSDVHSIDNATNSQNPHNVLGFPWDLQPQKKNLEFISKSNQLIFPRYFQHSQNEKQDKIRK